MFHEYESMSVEWQGALPVRAVRDPALLGATLHSQSGAREIQSAVSAGRQ